ncbi:MAG: hypothetical protein RL266_171 [Bacteroidota bacterium]|jgi:chromosome segregation ATPase
MIERRLIGALLIISLWGCRPDFTAEKNAADSLLSVVDNIERNVAGIDARLIKQYINNVGEKCSKLQQETTDTLTLKDAQILVDFCALDQHLQSCLHRKELIDTEVLRTRTQLFNLKSDLEEGRAHKDSVNNYIEQEFLFVESLDQSTDQIIAELNGCFSTYAELNEEIDRLLISLPSAVNE